MLVATGQPPVYWPDLALEQIFSSLPLGDLVTCRRVCRQWRALACLRRLQERSLLHTWTCRHRQQLEQAVNSPILRPVLAPWCEPPPSIPVAMDRAPSAQDLLRSTLQRLLLTARFHSPGTSTLNARAMEAGQLVCSPDGRWLAMPLHKLTLAGGFSIALLRLSPDGWTREFVFDREHPVCLLVFSPDSRELRILQTSGRLEIWALDVSDHWRRQASYVPFSGVCKAVVSADTRLLAVALHTTVLIFGPGRRGNWAGNMEWGHPHWNDGTRRFLGTSPDQLAMQLSHDNRHLVFAWGCEAFVCSRRGRDWRQQALALEHPVRRQPLFDSRSRLLVMATAPHCTDERSVDVTVRIWCWDREARWWFPVQAICQDGASSLAARSWAPAGCPVAMAFSPDNRLLALPWARSCQDISLWPVTGPGAWRAEVVLQCGKMLEKDGVYDCVQSVRFSATSRALAVITGLGVHVWICQQENTWRRVLQLGRDCLHVAVELAWSPDGYHLALACGSQGHVSIWGPAAGEPWQCKFSFDRGGLVEQLLFTPDGTRLIIATFGQSEPTGGDELVGAGFALSSCLTLLPLVPVWREPDAPEPQDPQDPQDP